MRRIGVSENMVNCIKICMKVLNFVWNVGRMKQQSSPHKQGGGGGGQTGVQFKPILV
jgi:uncharacterized spore protein YtfJ